MPSNVVKKSMLYLDRRPKVSMAATGILLAALAGWIDYVTGMEVSVALLYLIPVVLTAWYVDRWTGIAISAQCAIEGFLAGKGTLSSYSHPGIPYWNALMMFSFYIAVTLLLVTLRDSLKHEAALARTIQRNLLPDTLQLSPSATISAAWEPSVHVGGDYFDVFPLSADRIGFCIADATGHGIPAALLMSNVQSAIRVLVDDSISPASLCARLNRQAVTSFPEGDFVTLLLCHLHTATGLMTFSNAGHTPPILLRRDGAVEVPRGGGTPLGIVPSWIYHEESVRLHRGDIVFLYTDGVTEARNPAGELFGEDRLIGVLSRERTRGPEQIKMSVLEAVHAFSQGKPEDDITMVCLAFEGEAV